MISVGTFVGAVPDGRPRAPGTVGRAADARGVRDVPGIVPVERGNVEYSHGGWLSIAALERAVGGAMRSRAARRA